MTSKSTTTRRRSGGRRTKAEQRAAARRALARDVAGVALLVLGVLGGLGVYLDAAGPVGALLTAVFRGLLGVFGYVLPLALVAGGVLVLAERRAGHGRVVGGLAMTAAGLAGLWHLASGAPRLDAPTEALHAAAGWVGGVLVGPLVALAAPAGATVLLAALALGGLLVVSATSPRQVATWIATGADEGYGVARRTLDRLRARRATPVEEALEDTAPLDDEDTGPIDTPAELVEPPTSDPIIEGLHGPDGEAPVPEDDADTRLLPSGVDLGREDVVAAVDEHYELPDVELLRTGRVAGGNKRTLDQMTRALEHTMRQFNVDATVARVRRGATVTRFEIELGEGVRVGAVTKLGDDLAYALATPEIRIVAPIPGKSAIGIEVPNRERDLITLGDVLRSEEAKADQHPMTVGLGIDIGGQYLLANLTKMPHLLIAGATGSGKSVLMNTIVTSVLMRATPRQVRMILIDPKRVELNQYDEAPHLLYPVLTDAKRATEALEWVVAEMEQRYDMLSQQGFRNIDGFNAAVRRGDLDTPREGTHLAAEKAAATARGETWDPGELPYILVVIDELADLMMVAPRDVENAIVRIAQMARAVGIHLIVATQRPSVDVVTGLIKANVPSRIALSMATGHDSKTILNQYGAEKLVGDGDLLFQHANASKPHRLQGCFVDDDEVERIVAHCREQQPNPQRVRIVKEGEEARWADAQGEDASDADLTNAAMELVVRSGLGSTSMLQRKLKVGFARAGRLMDELEELGVVGPSEGPKARQVLMTVEELEERLGPREGQGGS